MRPSERRQLAWASSSGSLARPSLDGFAVSARPSYQALVQVKLHRRLFARSAPYGASARTKRTTEALRALDLARPGLVTGSP